MEGQDFLVLVLRVLHVLSAAVVVGGMFVMRIALPAGLAEVGDADARERAFLKTRRIYKMAVHPAILFLLVSGVFNSIRLWESYKGLHHFWGTHLLLGLVAFGIAFWLLMGKAPPAAHRKWAMINLILLIVVVILASTLKTVREVRARNAANPTTQAAR